MLEPFVIHFLHPLYQTTALRHGCGQRGRPKALERPDQITNRGIHMTYKARTDTPSQSETGTEARVCTIYAKQPTVVKGEETFLRPKGEEGRRRSSARHFDGPNFSSANREHRRFWTPASHKPGRLRGSRLTARHHVLKASQTSRRGFRFPPDDEKGEKGDNFPADG